MGSFMKTKIASFLAAAAFSVLTLASTSFADEETGFYDKDHIHGFVSIGADYRGMRSAFQDYVNKVTFVNGDYAVTEGEEQTTVTGGKKTTAGYEHFDNYYMGLHFNLGAQYKQFQTWIDLNFMPTQISEAPKSKYTTDDGYEFPLYDVKWYTYGADWMFGWKVFGESCFFNLIPAVGVGFNLMNVHFASNYTIDNDGEAISLRNRYYSVMATTVNTELEARLELGQLALGAYLGYRYIRYDELKVEGVEMSKSQLSVRDATDNNGDTYFLGLRLTWIFRSNWQAKQSEKL